MTHSSNSYPNFLPFNIEDQMLAHVTRLHEAQEKRKVEEEDVVVAATQEDATFVQDEASKVVDNTIVHGVIIDLTNTSVMDETPEASNAAIADEVEHNAIEHVSKQSTTSNKDTSIDKGEPDAIIFYSTGIGLAPLNYSQPASFTWDQVQDMIGQAMETFIKRQRQENEQFKIFMQNAITTQFSYLGVVLL